MQNKYLIRGTWYPTSSMRTSKYFLEDYVKHKARLNWLDFIGAFLQVKVKNRVFVKLDSICAEYFPEYSSYFGRALRLLKYMYVMTNSGKLFADKLAEWLIESYFIQSQCHMSIYYKYAPYGTNIVVLYYVDDCAYWYTSEALGKYFVDALGKIFHVNFLEFSHWFTSIRIS